MSSRMVLLIRVGDGDDDDDALVPKHTSHFAIRNSFTFRDGGKNYAIARGNPYLRNVLSLICADAAYVMVLLLLLYIIPLFSPLRDNTTRCIMPS